MIMPSLGKNNYLVDEYNERVNAYVLEDPLLSIAKINKMQEKNTVGKVIVYTTKEHIETFKREGYVEEASIDGFFNGEKGYILSLFTSGKRKRENKPEIKNEVLKIVENDTKKATDHLDGSLTIKICSPSEAEDLAKLYQKVFKFYPINIFDPSFLVKTMGKDYVFIIAKNGNTVVAAASAAIDRKLNCAEITDCASDPDYQGKSIITVIIRKLEEMLKEERIDSLYSTARSESVGMNMTLKRLGYKYKGQLLNHCKIYSGYEDLNVWSKYDN